MARNQQVVRQWEILRRLERGGASLRTLRLTLGVTERTIRRDLVALQEAQFPLYHERHDDGVYRWHLMPGIAAPGRRVA